MRLRSLVDKLGLRALGLGGADAPNEPYPGYRLVVHDHEPPRGARLVASYSYSYPLGHPYDPMPITIEIYEHNKLGYYVVREPRLNRELKTVVEGIIRDAGSWLKPSPVVDVDPSGYFNASLKSVLDGLADQEARPVIYYVRRDMIGYGPIDPILRDPLVEDVSCDGAGRRVRVWHSEYNSYGWLETPLSLSPGVIDSLVRRMSIRSGKPLSPSNPLLDASLPEGYRVTASWRREVSSLGSSFTIRKFRETPYTLPKLVDLGVLSYRIASFLWLMLELKGFVFVVGPSASGKTTLVNALAMMLNPSWKVISIEDVRELNLYHPGWKPLHTREGGAGGYGQVSLFDLVKVSVRERPDYIILGETRGEEARVLFQAALTGHGCLTTFHATDEESLTARLTQDPINVPRSLIDLVDLVVFVTRLNTGEGVSRVVLRVSEPVAGSWNMVFKYSGGVWEGDPLRSYSLENKAGAHGLTTGHVKSKLEEREDLLREAVKRRAFHPSKLLPLLRDFYSIEQALTSKP